MFHFISVLFLGALCLGQLANAGILEDETNRELASPRVISASELKSRQDTQFIFVDGIFGDFYKENFKPSEHVVMDEWRSECETIAPQTVVPIPDNAEVLYSRIRELRKNSTKSKLVLIGHSKGGAELMLMVLRHPELVRDFGLSALGIISSPLAGTHIVSAIDTVCAAHETNTLCITLSRLFPSLQTFQPEIIQPLYTEALANLSRADFVQIESRVHYVRTQMPEGDIHSPLYFTNMWLRKIYPGEGPNDGAIPTPNEIMYETGFDTTRPVFGTDLGIMMVDHNSLMNVTSDPQKMAFRKAFFRVLIHRFLDENSSLNFLL